MIKATGVVRKVDDLGRIVIPMELRKTLGINESDPLEIYVDDNGKFILRKYSPGCVFCGNMEGVKEFNGKNVCGHCLKELNKKAV